VLKEGKPYYLPQVSAPYTIVLNKLDNEGIDYNLVELNPSEDDNINLSQNYVFSHEIENIDANDMNPIWLSNDNEKIDICDGHHRYALGLQNNSPIKAVKINLNFNDACRVLNKIQDIYEYEQSQNIEEVETQDTINQYGDDENQFLNSLEEDNNEVQKEVSSTNPQTIIGYRKEPIKNNSVIGNFFSLNPIEGFDKYQIDLENLFDTQATGIAYKDSQNPIDILSKIWFPHVNFEKLAEKYDIDSDNLKHKAIAHKAKEMGYDGIKFDKIIWGLK